ncbi:MAG: PDDEXK nuclease domain-containing protein [Campylobacterota bacterium]|nr:PDDEXK nuclease domain-containing protein [Campylobacterota bacterium]
MFSSTNFYQNIKCTLQIARENSLELLKQEGLLHKIDKSLIDKIESFFLNLNRGFAFVSRQKRISTQSSHFYIDLVFYNYILKCFVLIDLKIGSLSHQDVGQMDMYVRLFDDLEKSKEDNPTIGIILCSDKDDTVVKYSVLNDSENLFASKYQLYLPSEEELKQEMEKDIMELRLNQLER